jgi:chromosome segregation ATPase
MATTALSPASQTTNGDTHDVPPPAPTAKKGKAKKEKQLSAEENAKLVQQRLSQLEQEKAGEKTQQAEVDREVKKAIRDLNELINGVEPLKGIDVLKQKYEDLFADMKKMEREHHKAKKSRDQYQKDAEKSKSENTKTAAMKDKLEKLCRELTRENKKLKEDNKKLEETEKQARENINERLDQMLYEVQDAMNSKNTSHSENLHLELDEL